MTFTEAVDILTEYGYTYYCRKILSGCDFDGPDGQVYLTEEQVIDLATSKRS